ncbi:biopolymer transporter ExbD [bacterium]|nr:biopolymer transporter ExbD [bacterium]
MAFAPSKARKLQTRKEPTVSLNSMMDMMTIILLFLLKSYSTSGALMQPHLDNLPESTVQKSPEKHLAVVVSERGVLKPSESATDKATMPILVPIGELASEEEAALPSLEAFLYDQRAMDEKLGKKEIAHVLTVEAAENIPYSWILKIVETATSVGFDTFDFVVTKIS